MLGDQDALGGEGAGEVEQEDTQLRMQWGLFGGGVYPMSTHQSFQKIPEEGPLVKPGFIEYSPYIIDF